MKPVHPHPEWRIVVALIQAREYGAVVTHGEIATATGLRYGSHAYYQHVNRARKTLLSEWARELEAVQKTGYRVVEPNEFHARSRKYVARSGKLLRRGIRTLAAAPQHLLTDAENAKNADTLSKFGAIETLRKRVMDETKPALPPGKSPDHPRMLTS